MSEIHGVIFDMDGLVFDSERIGIAAFMRTARHFGFQMNELMHFNLTGRVEADTVTEMQRMYGADKDILSWRRYLREQKAEIRAAQGGRVGKRPGLLELLSYLHEREIPFALASSSTRQTIDSYLASEYLLHEFTNIVDGSQVGRGKPDPEIFLRAADLIGVAPEHALVLEDGLAGLTAAQAGGFNAGFVYDDLSDGGSVDTGYPIRVPLVSIDEARELADYSFDTLADVIDVLESACPVRQ